MSRIKNENYITIQGWMINVLNLKGNELIIYAAIYGFSQTENQVFSGSLQYLADWTNSTKQGVMKNLKSLVEKGYIVKNEKIINSVKFCEYYATEFNTLLNKVDQGMQQSLTGGIKQSLPNNIDNISSNDNKEKKKDIKKKETHYDEVINSLIQDEDIKNAIYDFIEMRDFIKKPMTDRALTMLINKLNRLSSNKEIQLKILEKSIVNNWQDIFEYKEEGANRKNESNSRLNNQNGSKYSQFSNK